MELKVILFSILSLSCIGLSTSSEREETQEERRLNELLRMSDNNQEREAAEIFERELAQNVFKFSDSEPYSFQKEVFVVGLEKELNVLKHFGHLIQKLKFYSYDRSASCDKNQVRNSDVLSAINQHCSKALRELEIKAYGCGLSMFNQMIGPFEKVEIFSAYGDKFNTNNVTLNEVFPQVKEMQLFFKEVTSSDFIDHEFPQLEEFLPSRWLFNNVTEQIFESFFAKNPQIKSLQLMEPSRKALRYVNNHLPNLKSLTINTRVIDDADTDEIHFENVRSFNIIASDDGLRPPKNITFEDLHEIIFRNWKRGLENEAFDFILKFQNLRKLELKIRSSEELQNITGKLPNLNEVNFSRGGDFIEGMRVEDVVKFIESSQKINEISFDGNLYPVNFVDELKQQLSEHFDISLSRYELTIHRKIPVFNDA